MKRFIFNLEPVRALREQAERQAQEALARELELQRERRAAVAVAADRVALARHLGTAAGSLSSGRDLQRRQAYLERTERDERSARAGLAEQERAVADGRGRLLAAARERESLERLKRRRRDEHARAALSAETELLSEVALAAHRRRPLERAA